MTDPFLTTGEVAVFFGVCAKTVNKWAKTGLLTAHRLPGLRSNWRITRESVVTLLKATGIAVPPSLNS